MSEKLACYNLNCLFTGSYKHYFGTHALQSVKFDMLQHVHVYTRIAYTLACNLYVV